MGGETRREADERERAVLNQLNVQADARARRSVVAPASTGMTWNAELTVPPRKLAPLLRGSDEVVPVPMRHDQRLDFNEHVDEVLLDTDGTELVLWQRARRRVRGRLGWERLPYPDYLSVRTETTVTGCRLVATWHPHPATLQYKRWFTVFGVAALAVAPLGLLHPDEGAWIFSLLCVGLAVCSWWQRSTIRSPASRALTVLQEAVAPHRVISDEGLTPYRA